ncbi:hypothetical protein ABTX35_18075, partial [Streptomyces sp. NPDC096080]
VVILFVLTQVFSKMGMPPHFPGGVSYLDYVLRATDRVVLAATRRGLAELLGRRGRDTPGTTTPRSPLRP